MRLGKPPDENWVAYPVLMLDRKGILPLTKIVPANKQNESNTQNNHAHGGFATMHCVCSDTSSM